MKTVEMILSVATDGTWDISDLEAPIKVGKEVRDVLEKSESSLRLHSVRIPPRGMLKPSESVEILQRIADLEDETVSLREQNTRLNHRLRDSNLRLREITEALQKLEEQSTLFTF